MTQRRLYLIPSRLVTLEDEAQSLLQVLGPWSPGHPQADTPRTVRPADHKLAA